MIFVTIGTSEPFDRLIRAVETLANQEEVIAQIGRSGVRPAGVRCVEFLAFDEIVEHVERARVVITHAGAGTVITALGSGKRPIVVPRLARYGEAVDDHQVPFARRLAAEGLVVLVEDPAFLPEAIDGDNDVAATSLAPDAQLFSELRAYFADRIGPPRESQPKPKITIG